MIVIEREVKFGHEKLDVYRVAVCYAVFAYESVKDLSGENRHTRDQMLRASQSIALNIAEGNGKGTKPDRRRFFEIARGSALECAAIQDLLVGFKLLGESESREGKHDLHRIVSMLTKMSGDSFSYGDMVIREDSVDYDNDNESDDDNDGPSTFLRTSDTD